MKIRMMWNGLLICGTRIDGDWEGDPSIPYGTRTIPSYIEDLDVLAGDESLTEYLSDEGHDFFQNLLLEDDTDDNEEGDDYDE